jgi:hypothetical protein
MISKEQVFFGEIAFELLEHHWTIQPRNYNQLFVNYGFRNGIGYLLDGSLYHEAGEAYILRNGFDTSDTGIELISPHKKPFYTVIGLVQTNTSTIFKRTLFEPSNSEISDILSKSRRNIFEKELFYQVFLND